MKRNFDAKARTEQIEANRRRWTVTFYRICVNIRRPANLAFASLFLIFGWLASSLIRIPLPGINNPILALVWDYSIVFLILVLCLLLALAVLTMPPLYTKSIEAGLENIELVDSFGHGPALVRSEKIEDTDVKRLTFYSRGIAKGKWEEYKSVIEDVLNIHWVKDVQYGSKNSNHRNFIVLEVAPGAKSKREEPLCDDEL